MVFKIMCHTKVSFFTDVNNDFIVDVMLGYDRSDKRVDAHMFQELSCNEKKWRLTS